MWGVEPWTSEPVTDDTEKRLESWVTQPVATSENLMNVTVRVPEGHALLDCGAAVDCMGEVSAARTAQALVAHGERRGPVALERQQTFKFGIDCPPVQATFAVNLPVQIGHSATWAEACVVLGTTPHLISRRQVQGEHRAAQLVPREHRVPRPRRHRHASSWPRRGRC